MARYRWLPSPFTIAIAFATAGGTACGSDELQPGTETRRLRLVWGGDQTGTPGFALEKSIVVVLTDTLNNPVPGALVSWRSGVPGSAVADTSRTNAEGRAGVAWGLGYPTGTQTLVVSADSAADLTVSATATAFQARNVAVGAMRTCALDPAGATWCWSALGDFPSPEIYAPVQLAGAPAFDSLALGQQVGCGLTATGETWCWGDNTVGAVGTGTLGGIVTTPVKVNNAPAFRTLSAGGVRAGRGYVCGLTGAAAAEAWCWGTNRDGELGIGVRSDGAPAPVKLAHAESYTRIVAGMVNTCGLTADGRAFCWGLVDAARQFGAPPAGSYADPVAVTPESRFKALSLGRGSMCGLGLDDRAYCWGQEDSTGRLGLGDGALLQHYDTPQAVLGGRTYRQLVHAGSKQVFALTTDGKLWRWGSPGFDIPQTTPVAVAPELTFTRISGGTDVGGFCGIATTGVLYCGLGGDSGTYHVWAVPRP